MFIKTKLIVNKYTYIKYANLKKMYGLLARTKKTVHYNRCLY